MELYEEKQVQEKSNKNKYLKISLVVAVGILFILIITALVLPKPKPIVKLSALLNEVAKQVPEDMIITKENRRSIYFY